jgi:ABC-type multidrug transport system fused ATPase/permease subunit
VIFTSLNNYFKKILFLIGTDRKKLFFLLPLNFISSATDLIGIGLLVALISTLKDPGTLLHIANSIPIVKRYATPGTIDILIIILCVFVFVVFAIKAWIAVYVNKMTLKISYVYGAKLRSFLMGVYQRQSYDKFIQRNSSEYIYNIQTMAGQFVSYTVQPMLRIMGDGFVAFLIIGYLVVKDPFVLAFLLLLITIAGVLYDRAYRKKIAGYGSHENKISAKMIKSITEGLNGYKESHIFGIVNIFHQTVTENAVQFATSRIRSQIITTSSRYLLEFVVVVSIVLIIIAAIVSGRDKSELLTTLALFLVASMRLVPAANQIVTNINKLRYGHNAVEVLYKDIYNAGYSSKVDFNVNLDVQSAAEDVDDVAANFSFLEFQDVFFQYIPEGAWVLNAVNLRIDRHDIVGIIGPSGSGKTTMIALMLGFLVPQKGKVSCNGKDLAQPRHVREWHKKIAYLPQEVFLIDDTVARNIALGIDEDKIDVEKLRCALIKAKLSEMVEKMPDGVNTLVGEKGMWVSGGQRQRIVLARALYYDSEVLILDESTSALDSDTTDEIINELCLLKGKVTIVVITHHDTLLGLCNKVYKLDSGNLSIQQTYDADQGKNINQSVSK